MVERTQAAPVKRAGSAGALVGLVRSESQKHLAMLASGARARWLEPRLSLGLSPLALPSQASTTWISASVSEWRCPRCVRALPAVCARAFAVPLGARAVSRTASRPPSAVSRPLRTLQVYLVVSSVYYTHGWLRSCFLFAVVTLCSRASPSGGQDALQPGVPSSPPSDNSRFFPYPAGLGVDHQYVL